MRAPADPTPTQRAALIRLSRTARTLATPSIKPVLAAISEWLVIAACIVATFVSDHPAVWIGAALLIGCRQHGLMVLMHEAVHGGFHRDRRWNDRLADLLCGWPLFTSTDGYRTSHLAHHRLLNQPDDPDRIMREGRSPFVFPKSPGSLAADLLFVLFGGGVLSFVESNRRMASVSRSVVSVSESGLARVARLCIALGPPILALATGQLHRWLLLWALPILTVLPLLCRFRVLGEHFGMASTTVFDASRDWSGGGLFDWLVVPWGIRLHRTHHLFPAVPYHRLDEMRQILEADPELGPHCGLSGVGDLLGDLTGRPR